MIFKHGFVHCDAHPGNILVRRNPSPRRPGEFQIVLLDHGLYRVLGREFVEEFSRFWVALVRFDRQSLLNHARKLNI